MSIGGMTYQRIHCSCLVCKNKVSTNNLDAHYKSKQCMMGLTSRMSHAFIVVPQILQCVLCAKQCKNENSYRQHFIRCTKNSDAIKIKGNRTKGRTPWNKGLNKQTNKSLLEQSKTLSQIAKTKAKNNQLNGCFTKEYWTEEKRKEKSEWRKNLHANSPESHPNAKLAGNRNKMTYPEKVAFDYLQKNNIIFEHQKKILNYFVDFCINNVIIEIDGERWHPVGNQRDAKRDLELSNLGFTVYRIKSKEPIENRLEEILTLGLG